MFDTNISESEDDNPKVNPSSETQAEPGLQEKVATHLGALADEAPQEAVPDDGATNNGGEHESRTPAGRESANLHLPVEGPEEHSRATDAGGGRGPTEPPTDRPGGVEMPEEDPETPEDREALNARIEKTLRNWKVRQRIRELGFRRVDVAQPSDETAEQTEPQGPPEGYRVTDLEPGPERQSEVENLYALADRLDKAFARRGVDTGGIRPSEFVIVTDKQGNRNLRIDTRHFKWSPDLRDIIPAAQEGDVEAKGVLADLVEKNIELALGKKTPGDTEYDSIAEELRARLASNPFDPNYPVPEGTDPERIPRIVRMRFQTYIRRTARSLMVDRLEAQNPGGYQRITGIVGPLGEYGPAQTEQGYENGEIAHKLPASELDWILTSEQRDAIRLRIKGKTNEEIADVLGKTEAAIKAIVARGRSKIEETLLEPAGIKPLPEFSDYHRLRNFIKSGQIPGIQVLGMWYFHENWRPREIPIENYLRLSATATNAEAIAFMHRHPERVVIFRRTAYIDQSDLGLLAEIQGSRQEISYPVPPQPGYTSIPEVARTYAEDGALRNAMKAGHFSDVLHRRKNVFIPRDEALRYLEEYRRRQGSSETP